MKLRSRISPASCLEHLRKGTLGNKGAFSCPDFRKDGERVAGLTNKQEAFVLALIEGKSQREAYRSAYKAGRMKDETVDQCACRLLKNPKVSARYEELQAAVRGEAEQRSVATAADVLEELSNVGMGRVKYPAYDMFGNEHQQFPSVTQRTKALELLGKNYGLFTDKVNMSGVVPVVITGGDELED